MNWKTTLLGFATIVVALGTAVQGYLGHGAPLDLGILISTVTAGVGLILAKDASNRF